MRRHVRLWTSAGFVGAAAILGLFAAARSVVQNPQLPGTSGSRVVCAGTVDEQCARAAAAKSHTTVAWLAAGDGVRVRHVIATDGFAVQEASFDGRALFSLLTAPVGPSRGTVIRAFESEGVKYELRREEQKGGATITVDWRTGATAYRFEMIGVNVVGDPDIGAADALIERVRYAVPDGA